MLLSLRETEMPRKVLKNKPLVEAIFELKWELEQKREGIFIDPHYKLLIGSLYSQIKAEYPYHEMLPAAAIPDEVAGHVIQHRFRTGKNEWPLIQIGPGILTLNETEGYVWENFETRVKQAIAAFLAVHPEPQKLAISSLLLRYIDAIEFDYAKDNVFDFLSLQMKTEIKPYTKLFDSMIVDATPASFDWRFTYPCRKPAGMIHLRFLRGKKQDKDALIWETMVQSLNMKASLASEMIGLWISDAHDLTDDWFFKLIEGKLESRFS